MKNEYKIVWLHDFNFHMAVKPARWELKLKQDKDKEMERGKKEEQGK